METIVLGNEKDLENKLIQLVIEKNGNRRGRKLDESDVKTFLQTVAENPDKSVQLRAEAVANSYSYRADATYLRYNYTTKNYAVGAKTFKVSGGDGKNISVKKYNYGF